MQGGYSSEFDDGGDKETRKRKYSLETDHKTKLLFHGHTSKIPSKSSYVDAYEREEKKAHFSQFLSMNAYQRHQKLVHDYIVYYGGSLKDFERDKSKDKTDCDVLRENHRFVWDDESDEADSWGKKLAKRYYDKLFKEYCISDLSRYKENKFAMRWRVEQEVVAGKGQFVCGARKCDCNDGLKTWEVNFAYKEHGERKNTLVKLRLCPDCSYKLNYNHKHKKVKKKKKKKNIKSKTKKSQKTSDQESTSSSEESSAEENKDVEDRQEKSTHSIQEKEDETNIWKKPIINEVEKTKDEELDEYLEDLFM